MNFTFFLFPARFENIFYLTLSYLGGIAFTFFLGTKVYSLILLEMLRVIFPFSIIFLTINFIFVSKKIKNRILLNVYFPLILISIIWFFIYKQIFF